MKRFFAMLLCAALLLSLFPVTASAVQQEETPLYVYTEADNARLDADVFAAIDAVKASAAQTCGGIGRMTEQDYIDLVPQVIEAVKASATYVPGTLQANGNFLVWQTTVGIPCCYDPRMEAELHNTENDPTPEQIAAAEAQADAILQSVEEICGGGPYTPEYWAVRLMWALGNDAPLLPPDMRQMIVLRDMQGRSYEEIGEILDIPLGTVKSRVSRAKAKLQEWLAEGGELSPPGNVQQSERRNRS